jgi:hypothetical protein
VKPLNKFQFEPLAFKPDRQCLWIGFALITLGIAMLVTIVIFNR